MSLETWQLFGFAGLLFFGITLKLLDDDTPSNNVEAIDILLFMGTLIAAPLLGLLGFIVGFVLFLITVNDTEFIKEDGKWKVKREK